MWGYSRDGREFGIGPVPDPGQSFHTRGVTSNLSRGGMEARIEDVVAEGNHCLVRFLHTDGKITPELRWGLVLRSTPSGEGCVVAVKFDNPLETLALDTVVPQRGRRR